MKKLYLFLILFFLLVFEGIALELLPSKLAVGDLLIIPHWIFIFLFLMSVYYEKESIFYSIIFAITFGLLIDIVYTGILGVYMFVYPVALYLLNSLKKLLHENFLVILVLSGIGIIVTDGMIHIVYTVIGITNMEWLNYLIYRLLPTVLANLIFLIVLYPIMKSRLIKWQKEQVDTTVFL